MTQDTTGAAALKTPAADCSGAGSPGESSLEALLISIFESWTKRGIEFLVLRNYENLPSSTGNDVDVLVAPNQLETAERLMIAAARQCGYLMHNRVEFATLSCFFFHPESLNQIQIDLFSTLSWHAFEIVSTREVLEERQKRGLFCIPHPVHEAVIDLLTRLVYQGSVKEKYRPVILAGFSQFPDRARALLAKCFGDRLASEIVRLSLGQQWESVERMWRTLRRELVLRRATRHPIGTLGSLFGDGLRFIRRMVAPGGLVVVVMGPDGSGKSTVSEVVVEKLRNTFNPGKMLRVHWKPVVFFKQRRKPTGRPTVDPHKKPPRNAPSSMCYLLGHWAEFLLGSHFGFRKAAFKNGLVLVDRYHYDFLVDQRRYRLNVPKGLVRLLFKTVKRPDLVFLFDAAPEVFQARKQEVPFAETARQVTAYRALIQTLPQGRILNAAQPVNEVAHDMTAEILRCLASRTARRHAAARQLSPH